MQIGPRIKKTVFLKSLAPGSVFRLRGDEPFSSDKYHVFIVLGFDGASREMLVLANGTSQVDKSRERLAKMNADPEHTAVVIEPGVYPFFPKQTLINCNSISVIAISDQLFVSRDILPISERLSNEDLNRIINAVLASRQVSQHKKDIIEASRPKI